MRCEQDWKPLELRCFFLMPPLVYIPQCLTFRYLFQTSPFTMTTPQFQPLFQTWLLHTDPHWPSIGLPVPHISGSWAEILEGGILLHPVTLTWLCWQISASSKPVTHLITPPALVPPQNSSTLEALLSQLQTDSQDSWNLVPHSNLGTTNTTLNIHI